MHAMTRFIRGLSPESKRALLDAEGSDRRKALRGLADSTDDADARRFLAAYLRDPSLDPDRVEAQADSPAEEKTKAVAAKIRRIGAGSSRTAVPEEKPAPAPPMAVRKVHQPEGGRTAGTAWSPPPPEQGAKRLRPGSSWKNPRAHEAPEPDDAT